MHDIEVVSIFIHGVEILVKILVNLSLLIVLIAVIFCCKILFIPPIWLVCGIDSNMGTIFTYISGSFMICITIVRSDHLHYFFVMFK